jgi:hypothetical protein
MAVFRAIQCAPMPDIRQLTVCSRKWAAERPRCLSLTVKEADSLGVEQATQRKEALLQARFGIAALAGAAASAISQVKAAGSRPSACHATAPHDEEFEWISNRRLATMEWLPLP